jgi:hypothetical protein
LKVTRPSYFLGGMHVGQQVVGGVSFLQGTIINTTTNDGVDVPVTVGDNLRVDGWLQRGPQGLGDNMDVKINDNLRMAGNIALQPGKTVDGVDISELRIYDWNTAFSWGNHASAGYLTVYSETDPIFTASVAAGIVPADIINWNTAFSWGDHAAVGYLTSYTEIDPVWTAAEPNYANLGQAETIAGNWVNVANPWADDEVAALSSGVQGDILYHDGASWTQLAAGTSGQFLQTQGAGADPQWASAGGAPPDATYLVSSANVALTNEVVVSALASDLTIQGDDAAVRTITLGQTGIFNDIVVIDAGNWSVDSLGNASAGGNFSVAGTTTLGGGSAITGLRFGTCSVDPPNIFAIQNGQATCIAAGVTASDEVFVTAPNNLEDALILHSAEVTANNTITIELRNVSLSSVNGTTRTWTWLAVR